MSEWCCTANNGIVLGGDKGWANKAKKEDAAYDMYITYIDQGFFKRDHSLFQRAELKTVSNRETET